MCWRLQSMGRAVLAVLLQLGAGLPPAAAQNDVTTIAACSPSPDHDGDVAYDACFGWCSPSQAEDHCTWCKVRAPRSSTLLHFSHD